MQELPIAQPPCRNQPREIKIDLCFAEEIALTDELKEKITGGLGSALKDMGKSAITALPAKPGRYRGGLMFTPDGLDPGESGLPGVSVTFGDSPTRPDDSELLQSLSQTWQWDEAEEIVPTAPFRVYLRSVNSLDLGMGERIALVQRSLYALTKLLKPEALIFPHSQCCIDPASYLENDPNAEDYFCIYGLVNARVFTSEEEEGGQSVFMDTLGLDALGLPDAQCLASDAETDFAELAYWLYNLAEYMRETPGEFEDGDTIIGLNDEEWELSYSAALIEPERCVLNVNTMQIDLEDLNFEAED